MKSVYNFTVRGYELDSFCHVNNAVYLNYYEQARWVLLNEHRIFQHLKDDHLFMVLTEVNIKFRNELKIFDECNVFTEMEMDGNFIIMKQSINLSSNNKLISSAYTKLIFVDYDRIPHSIPGCIIELLNNNRVN